MGASGPERSENKEYTEGKILEEGKHINTSIKHRLSEQLGKNVPLGVLPK